MSITLIGTFLVSGLALGSIYALSGVGLVLLNRATGVLNFAYGAIGACSALMCWQLVQWKVSNPISWFVAVLVSIILSFLYGRILAPLLAHREAVVKTIATLGYALILLGLLNWLWIEQPRRLSLPTDTIGFRLIGVRITVTRLICFVGTILLTGGIISFLNKTRMGLWMRAVSNNRDQSALLGVPIGKVETWAWVFSGLLAGITGIFLATLVRLDAGVLTFLVIPAMAAAVVGQLRSLPITLVGGLLIGIIEALSTLVPGLRSYRSAAPFIIAILVIIWLQRKSFLTFSKE